MRRTRVRAYGTFKVFHLRPENKRLGIRNLFDLPHDLRLERSVLKPEV
jgi:hypothetical protein